MPHGTGGNDYMYGGDGDDYFRGHRGNDHIYGGKGNDWLRGDWGIDWLYGQDGHDSLWGGLGDDWLDGGKGNDWLDGYGGTYGDGGADTFVFRPGDGFDYFFSLDASDTIRFIWGDREMGRFRFGESKLYGEAVIAYGDGGTDDGTVVGYWNRFGKVAGDGGGTVTVGGLSLAEFRKLGIGFEIHGGDGDNTLFGAFGRDTLYGGKGDDTLKGKGNDDVLHGGDGNDTLYGGKGNDTLLGGVGADWLGGGKNDDTLWGGQGDDILRGGFGADRFSFRGGDGDDTILDFGDGDTIRLVDVGHGFDGLTITADADGNAVLSYGDAGDTVTLLGVAAESLTESDFLFS